MLLTSHSTVTSFHGKPHYKPLTEHHNKQQQTHLTAINPHQPG